VSVSWGGSVSMSVGNWVGSISSIVGHSDVSLSDAGVWSIDSLRLLGDRAESSESSDGVLRLSSKSVSSIQVSWSDGSGSSDHGADDEGLGEHFYF
jgi:hypothetical protein